MFFKRFGLQDWLIQRFTALYLVLYFSYLIGFWMVHSPLTHVSWMSCFDTTPMKIATCLAIFAILAHAWIGIWTVLTDYIKPYCIRMLIQGVVIAALVGYGIWGVAILWGGV